MNSILAAGLYLQKRTKTMFGIMAASLIVNVVLNLLLLPRFAITGAAVATLIATVTSSVLTWFYARSYIRLVFPTGTIAFYLALAAVVFLVGTMIDNGGDWKNLLLMLGVESALVLVAIACREGEARAQIRKLLGAPS
jgi:O-antigen/teichoic acid export membrane protein